MVLITKRTALIFDKKGEYFGKLNFNKHKETIKYIEKSFNIFTDNISRVVINGLFVKRIYHFYNIDNPNPLILTSKVEPVLNSNIYNVMLETDVARKLNDLNKSGLMKLMTPKNLLIGAVIIGIAYYFLSGGTIN